MRAVISQVSLNDAMGDRRADIEDEVAKRMQTVLDAYRSGVQIQGIAIKQADPPDAVNDAFKQVTAAQQDAQTYINNANAYALQLRQKSQGEATAFEKVYEQYRLSPEVTRRRMYYETMEKVLENVDKTIIEAPGVTPYLPLPETSPVLPQFLSDSYCPVQPSPHSHPPQIAPASRTKPVRMHSDSAALPADHPPDSA